MTPVVTDEDKLDKLHVDVYEGRGKDNPSIVTRLALLEDAVMRINRRDWLVAATLLAALADIIKSFIMHH